MLEKKIVLSKASVVRLLACQALVIYNNGIILQKDIKEILKIINSYFILEFLNDENKKNNFNKLYKNNFIISLIEGIINNQVHIDSILEVVLRTYNTIENLLDTTRECFRLAIYELENFKDIGYEIIVNEYVDIIAELTNDPKETKFANAILEKLALQIRNIVKEEKIAQENVQRKKLTLKTNTDTVK